MEKSIVKLLRRPGYAPANVPELLQLLKLPRNQQQALQEVLRHLEDQGQILRTKGNRYILAREADLVPGIISINRGGKGFLQPTDSSQTEIAIPPAETGTALNGDRVLVRRDMSAKGPRGTGAGAESTGTVIRILERKRTQFVGTLQQRGQLLFVIPDDPRLAHHIQVPPPRDVGRPAHAGDKVVVELAPWESREENPQGEIIEVLGAPDAEGVDMLSVVRHYDLALHFPKHVLDEANAIAKSHALDEEGVRQLDGRVDCREHLVITIDPDDAKDFDDAICLERVGRDRYKLWVHIADVSHYVVPGSALDTEARERGNSTYLVDRVIPMLPEALSNGLCSLKPGVDRLTKCVEFLLSDGGEVLETKFYAAVIHSKRRFSYQEALQILLREPSNDPIERMLHAAHAMAQRLRKRRFKAGSLDLDFPENKIRLDEKGRVVAIERMENDISHQLIEEYMLLANEAVAVKLMSQTYPAMHRVHEAPKASRMQQFREEVLSHHIPCGDLTLKAEVQKLLARLHALPVGAALKIGFLRSLMRARYAVEPLGHYGLAKPEYTHFTSPIRRYADLVVHRALFADTGLTAAQLQEIAEHISATERNSADAERDSREVKLYAHLTSQLTTGRRQKYPAMVTDLRNFGFMVEVPGLGMSGLVHLSSMDDFYVYEPDQNRLIGRSTRRIIKLGDHLTVQVASANVAKKQVDFELVATGRGAGGGGGRDVSGDRRHSRAKGRRGDERSQGGGRKARGNGGGRHRKQRRRK